MDKEELKNLMEEYAYSSNEDAFTTALRKSLYSGMTIGFVVGVGVAVIIVACLLRGGVLWVG